MPFWKASNANGKITLLANKFHELRRKFKAAGRGLKFAATRRIAAQGENIFAVQRADFFKQGADFVAGVVDASKMRQRGEAMLPLDAVHNHQGLVTRAATCAVGDGAKIWSRCEQGGNLFFQQGAVALVGFWREKFKGDDRLFCRHFFSVDVADESHGFGSI